MPLNISHLNYTVPKSDWQNYYLCCNYVKAIIQHLTKPCKVFAKVSSVFETDSALVELWTNMPVQTVHVQSGTRMQGMHAYLLVACYPTRPLPGNACERRFITARHTLRTRRNVNPRLSHVNTLAHTCR